MFDLPKELLSTLHLKSIALPQSSEHGGSVRRAEADTRYEEIPEVADAKKPPASCHLCRIVFQNVTEQRLHIRSDWHGYNLKQKLKGLHGIDEAHFDKLVEDLDESISGSEESESEIDEEQKETTLNALLKKQAKLHHEGPELDVEVLEKRKRSSGKPPLLWFTTSLLPQNISLGVYRALFSEEEQQENSRLVELIHQKQLSPIVPQPGPNSVAEIPAVACTTDPQIFMCMIGGGHFAAMIVSLAPVINKKHKSVEERQAQVIAHKTFHRYTTRRKQGGSQSANDSAKGAAKSAGASIRRYNEMALESEIRALLTGWKKLIDESELIITRATGSSNRRIIFGPYDGQTLKHDDPRNRTFPFSTRRATQAELMRAFVELTRVKVSEVDEEALAAAAAAEKEREVLSAKAASKPLLPRAPKANKEDEAALLHTSQLQALIRRTKAPATLTYLTSNKISVNFEFQPCDTQANHHAPTPLHLASSINSPVIVLSLLTKAAASPLKVNGEGKVAFDLAGDRATRDAFRVARSELGEERWDWDAAHCPPALSKADADKREKKAKAEEEKGEAERRKIEIEQLKLGAANDAEKGPPKMSGKALGAIEKTGAEKREEEARGMTPEMRVRLERERRARAAEERVRRMANGTSSAGAGR